MNLKLLDCLTQFILLISIITITVIIIIIRNLHPKVPEDTDDGEPKPLFDAVHLTQHQVHVDEDQHVPHHQLVRVLQGHNEDKKFTLLHFKHTSNYTLNNRRDIEKNITITIISASSP